MSTEERPAPQPAAEEEPAPVREQWGYGNPEDKKPWGTAIMGSAERPCPMHLLWGEHPHSRSDNRLYARDANDPEARIIEFDGHRILIDVVIRSENYLKSSYYSGDEIRKGGSGVIIADGVQVYEFFFRDPQWALLKAHQIISKLSEHSSGWFIKSEREKLVGRKIYYERTPAVITRLIEDQGCMIIAPDGVPEFPAPIWALEGDTSGDDDRKAIKVEVDSPSIWWFRKEKEEATKEAANV